MPNYDYECSSCNYHEEIFRSISSEPLTQCPQCGEETFRIVILGAPRCRVVNLNTIGTLSERNWSNKGFYERSEILEKNKSSNEKVEKMKEDRKIDKLTPEQAKRYIQTGEL